MRQKTIDESEQIAKIFQRVKAEGRRISLKSGSKTIHAAISDFDGTHLDLVLLGAFLPEGDEALISFIVGGDSYIAHSKIIANRTGSLVIEFPERLENRFARRMARVFVEGKIFSRFHILLDDSEAKETNPASVPPKLAPIFIELQQKVPDIRKILVMIGNELKTLSPNAIIKLHKDNEVLSEEVRLVKKYKRSFWIADTENAKDLIKDVISNDIINYSVVFKEMKRAGVEDKKIGQEVLARQKRYLDGGFASLIVVPIRFFESVIGHISLASLLPVVRHFRISDVYYVMALADIVSEALAKAKLFKLDTGAEFDVPVINIGSGGAYLSVNSQHMIKFLNPRLRLGLDFSLMNRVIKTVSEIRRLDFSGSKANIALRFLQLSPEDQTLIDKFVRDSLEHAKTVRA